jgi:formylglycine-generating enzyme required for sulfatase activity
MAMEAPTNMVFIPPGTFRMGSPENEEGRCDCEGPQTDVIISRGFWMGKRVVAGVGSRGRTTISRCSTRASLEFDSRIGFYTQFSTPIFLP